MTVQLPGWVPLAPADYALAAKVGRGSLVIAGRPAVKVPGSLRPSRPAFAKLAGTGTLAAVTLTRTGVKG